MLAERKGRRRGKKALGGGGGVEIKTLRGCCLKVDRAPVFTVLSGLYDTARLNADNLLSREPCSAPSPFSHRYLRAQQLSALVSLKSLRSASPCTSFSSIFSPAILN